MEKGVGSRKRRIYKKGRAGDGFSRIYSAERKKGRIL